MDADRIAGEGAGRPPNVDAFLDTIAVCEGIPDGPIGYRVLYGYHRTTRPDRLFDSFDAHPHLRFWIRTAEPVALGATFGPNDTTTAAGRYQATWPTWSRYRAATGAGPRFGPDEQDAFGVWCLEDCGAYDLIVAGSLREALRKASPVWASLPDSDAGQNPKSLAFAENAFAKAGGVMA